MNWLYCLVVIPIFIGIAYMKIADTSNQNLKLKVDITMRPLSQTYYTLPEWMSVDIVKEYGKFMEHTPYYEYPYWYTIGQYWKVFIREGIIVYKKCGLSEALFSSYFMMNTVVGLQTTFMFGTMSLLSLPVRLMYSGLEDTTINMTINNSHHNLTTIDPRIKIINKDDTITKIKVPRYVPFMEIVLKLARNNIKIDNIAGNKEIQMKLLVNKEIHGDFIHMKGTTSFIFDNQILPQTGCTYLLQYDLIPTSKYQNVAISVDIEKLHTVVTEIDNINESFMKGNKMMVGNYTIESKGLGIPLFTIDHIFDY